MATGEHLRLVIAEYLDQFAHRIGIRQVFGDGQIAGGGRRLEPVEMARREAHQGGRQAGMKSGFGDEAAAFGFDLRRDRFQISEFLGAELDIEIVDAEVEREARHRFDISCRRGGDHHQRLACHRSAQ